MPSVGNAQSAMMMGLNVKKTKFKSIRQFSDCLHDAADSSFCLNSCSGFVEQAKGLEMDAISASVIGGTLLSGGVGTPFGTVFGVLIKGTISSLITTQGISFPAGGYFIALSALLCFFIVLQSIIGSMKKKELEIIHKTDKPQYDIYKLNHMYKKGFPALQNPFCIACVIL